MFRPRLIRECKGVEFFFSMPKEGDDVYIIGLGQCKILSVQKDRNLVGDRIETTTQALIHPENERPDTYTIFLLKKMLAPSRYDGMHGFKFDYDPDLDQASSIFPAEKRLVTFYTKGDAQNMLLVLQNTPGLGGKESFSLVKRRSGRTQKGKDIYPFWDIMFLSSQFDKKYPEKEYPSMDIIRGICYGYLLRPHLRSFHY